MNQQPVPAAGDAEIPQWDTADRMRKALRVSGMSAGEMAAYLGVGRNTVSTWINGKIRPSTQTLRLWALRCGVSYEWLKNGTYSQVAGGSKIQCSFIPRNGPAIVSGPQHAYPLTIDHPAARRAA